MIACMAGVALFAAAGQDPEPQRPVFHTEANYVRVDVYPTTVQGVPVGDLKQDDFEIFDDGAPQKIVQFQHIEVRGNVPQDVRHEPNNVADMRAMMTDPNARVFALFLDLTHVSLAGSHEIRKPLTEMLDRAIGQDDLVGVMTPQMSALDVTFSRRSTTIENFLSRHWDWGDANSRMPTDPVEKLYQMCYPGVTEECIDPSGRKYTASDVGVADEMIARRREEMVIDSLEDLIRYLGGVREERKAVLLISPGMAPLRAELEAGAAGAMRGARDAAGRRRSARRQAHDARRDGRHRARHERAVRARSPEPGPAQRPSTFPPAAGSGESRQRVVLSHRPRRARRADIGRRHRSVDESDRRAARSRRHDRRHRRRQHQRHRRGRQARVAADLSSYYLLGYYSTNLKLDGKFHAIKVRVNRAGVQVRARRGYLAPSAAEMTRAGSRRRPRPRPPPPRRSPMRSRRSRDSRARCRSACSSPAGWTPAHAGVIWAVGELGARRRGDDRRRRRRDADERRRRDHRDRPRAHMEPRVRSFRVALAPSGPSPQASTSSACGRAAMPAQSRRSTRSSA